MIRHIIAVISALLILLILYILNKNIAIGALGGIASLIIVEVYFFMGKNDFDLTFLGLKRLFYVFKKRKIIK